MTAEDYKLNMERMREPMLEFYSQVRFLCWLLVVIAALCFLFTQILIGVRVSGSSMLPTLENGDYLFVSTLRSPSHGDIVVIEEDEYEDGSVVSRWLIKRVVGLPGDTLWAEDGVLYRIDAGTEGSYAVDEPYLAEKWTVSDSFQPVTVPDGYVFVLGDNRNDSHDSRSVGPLPQSSMLGVVTEWSIGIKGALRAFFGLFSGA